jgi:hypothetical protein
MASSTDRAARAECITRSSLVGRSVISTRPAVGVDHAPTAGANRLHPSGDASSRGADHEMSHRADHEQEAQGVTDESGNTDQDSGEEDDQSVEELPRRHLATTKSLLGVHEHPETDSFDHEGSERADTDQDDQGPEEANLVGNSDEGGDLCADEHQKAEEDHIRRVTPHRAGEAAVDRRGTAAPARSLACRRSEVNEPLGVAPRQHRLKLLSSPLSSRALTPNGR